MSKIHIIKIQEEYYTAVLKGKKTFELRKNDRDYKVGDLVRFTVNDELKDKFFLITYVLKDVPQYGLAGDYCIFAIKPIEKYIEKKLNEAINDLISNGISLDDTVFLFFGEEMAEKDELDI